MRMDKPGATRQFDPLLLPFLQAADRKAAQSLLAQLLSEQAAPVIKSVLRSKLRVSLSVSDGSFENQEALEIESEVIALVLAELNELQQAAAPDVIGNFRSYVAVVTFHACARYLRGKNPQRGQLKSRLRYLLNTRPDFGLWQSAEKNWLCGFKHWQDREPVRSKTDSSSRQINGPHALANFAARGPQSAEHLPLEELLPAMLNWAGTPVAFEELVNAIADFQGLKKQVLHNDGEAEAAQELAQLPDTRADVAAELDQRLYLQKLWTEIGGLPHRQRVALLLNLKDAQGRGMIALFPLTSVATMPQLAATLEMPLEKFAAIWNELPWEDAAIALNLGLTRQQVVNLRKCARERLARRMKGF
jgi:hypothetical protein